MMGLALTGAGLRSVVQPVWKARPDMHSPTSLREIEGVTGAGLRFGLLGGFRAIAADLAWLKTYMAWERRDVEETESMLHLTTALDERPLCFWLNSARMIAYDFPAWHRDNADGAATEPVDDARVSRSLAQRSIAFLERGISVHSESAPLWIERANIELNCLHDLAAAAESYRRASELPNAPYFPARIHAELLRRLGRKTDALSWLKALHPRLPPDLEAAAADLVLSRIRDLEIELSIPPPKRFIAGSSVKPVADGPLTAAESAR